MSLQTRLAALITAIGADIKALGDPGLTPADAGFLLWNQSPYACNTGSLVAASGTLFGCRLVNHKSTTITVSAVTVLLSTLGSGLTNVGFAIYDSTGALLQSSVNANGATTAAFGSVNPRTVTFTPQVIAAGAAFYVCWWFTSTTTQPSFYRSTGTNFVANVGSSSPNYRFFTTSNTGLTTTAPSSLGTMTFSGTAFFVAVA